MAEINWLIACSARSCEPFRYLLNCDWKRALGVDFALSLASVLLTVWPFVWPAFIQLCDLLWVGTLSQRENALFHASCILRLIICYWSSCESNEVIDIALERRPLHLFCSWRQLFVSNYPRHWCFPLEFRRFQRVVLSNRREEGEMPTEYKSIKEARHSKHFSAFILFYALTT